MSKESAKEFAKHFSIPHASFYRIISIILLFIKWFTSIVKSEI